MDALDMNVSHYTVPELLKILDINDEEDFTKENIIAQTEMYAAKFKNDNKIELSSFFLNMQEYLLNILNDDQEERSEFNEKQTLQWYENQVLPQTTNPVQKDKNTDRVQKIDVYNNNHVPMNRDQLGVNNTVSLSVAQDTLNPVLENVTKRFINLDSKYRQSNGINGVSTDYVVDLTEPLTNVLSLRLYSFQIPYGWYIIDAEIGNNYFWIDDTIVVLPSGNYNPVNFVTSLTKSIEDAGFIFGSTPPVSYSYITGKITLHLYGSTGKIINENTELTFWSLSKVAPLQIKKTVQGINAYNNTLGYLMGFRELIVKVNQTGNIPPAILDLYGPKYLILAIDDYKHNRINNGLIGITEYSKTLKMPAYYSPDLPYTCTPSLAFTTTAAADIAIDKLGNTTTTTTQTFLPSAPRILTQSQLYSINEIQKNKNLPTSYKLESPTTIDTFAIIPFKKGSMTIGDTYTELTGSLQDNKRIYFGPVNIDRLHIMLYDDKGHILNLNGLDWTITLISENLYQY